MIASDIDESRPATRQWHRDLLSQTTLQVAGLRPAVISHESRAALVVYLEFRHLMRNIYSFDLRLDRIAELVRALRPTFLLARRDLLDFAAFLDDLSTAQPEEDPPSG